MARQGYISIYADEHTQKIFDKFTKIKGITKSTALTEMMEIYMLCQDEELYLQLKKDSLGVDIAKQALIQRTDINCINDYIFMKLSDTSDVEDNPMTGTETIKAYERNCEENGYDYTWFSTQSLHFGMAKAKVKYYNEQVEAGNNVKMLFAVGEDVNDITYSADVLEIKSDRESLPCPGVRGTEPEEFASGDNAKIWIKIANIKPETELKAAMLNVRSTDANLKQVITNSQFHFGYVYIPEEQNVRGEDSYRRYQCSKRKYKTEQITVPIVALFFIAVVTKYWWLIIGVVVVLICVRNNNKQVHQVMEKVQDKEEIMAKKSKWTEVGSINSNSQINRGRTDKAGTDNLQWFYDMECMNCGHRYYSNGSNIYEKKCPACQGGRP